MNEIITKNTLKDKTASCITCASMILTAASIVLSIPELGIDQSHAAQIISRYNLQMRILILILIELSLAFGFSFMFSTLASKQNLDNYEHFIDPTFLFILILTTSMSAWVSYFNIDIFIADQSTDRNATLLYGGIITCIIGTSFLAAHSIAKLYLALAELALITVVQTALFIAMFYVYSIDHI